MLLKNQLDWIKNVGIISFSIHVKLFTVNSLLNWPIKTITLENLHSMESFKSSSNDKHTFVSLAKKYEFFSMFSLLHVFEKKHFTVCHSNKNYYF